ncbi:MAG: hypothetical protein JRI41_02925 [Deltaproteobacteria bacterium]|nr:hypothetical protein [Deltaproteobacteria bacterium]
MEDQKLLLAQGTGAAVYLRLGWCPAKVILQGSVEEDSSVWTIDLTAAYGIESIDSTGVTELTTDTGITLVQFEGDADTIPTSAPTSLEPAEYYKANGIAVAASAACNVDGNPFTVHAFRLNVPIVKGIHDGTTSSNTYFEDSSVDFIEAGVSGNGKFIIINETNDNMAYVGEITKPAGKDKYCRIYTYEDESLTTATAAADFDTSDVVFIIPRMYAQYPPITAMT